MGVQKLMIMIMFMALFSYSPASFAPVSKKNLVSENSQNTHENDSVVGGDNGMLNQNKYATVPTRGGGGDGGDGGGRSNSSPQGGNGVVPTYAAGAAAGQRRNHKGDAATCSRWWNGGFAGLIAIASSSILLHTPM